MGVTKAVMLNEKYFQRHKIRLRELNIFDGSNSVLQMLRVRAVKYDSVDVAGCELHK